MRGSLRPFHLNSSCNCSDMRHSSHLFHHQVKVLTNTASTRLQSVQQVTLGIPGGSLLITSDTGIVAF
jgi:hypothetical protein